MPGKAKKQEASGLSWTGLGGASIPVDPRNLRSPREMNSGGLPL